jgi:two-component system sensor histidine kinase/response regulator
MSAALVTMMLMEFAFTQYASAYTGGDLIGHILKVFAYWFIWVALVQTNLMDPFSLLARAASTYDAVPDTTLIVLASGSIRQANRAAGKAAKLEASSLVGRSSHELFHDPHVLPQDCPVCSRLGRGVAFTEVLSLPGPQFVECSVTPFADTTEHSFSVQVVRDITEQHASEERFRALFENMRLPTILLDDGRAVAVNHAALELQRFEKIDELVGRAPADVAPLRQPNGQLSSELAAQHVSAALAQGSLEFDWEMVRSDGQAIAAHVMLTVIRIAGRQMLHSVWRDITQERREQLELAEYRRGLERRVQERTAELQATTESLNRSNAERQAVFDAATVGIILKRGDFIQRSNRTMETLFGWGSDDLIGKTTRAFYPDDQSYQAEMRRLQASLLEGGSFTEERELVRKDGSRLWCRKTDVAIDRNDPSRGVAVTFEDTTSEHEAMAEMARARALAEDLARTKSEFLANMSHEIRTPMNSVIGMTHLALKADPSPRVRDYLEKIQAAGRHLLAVISDILDFSKLEARKLTIASADFSLNKVMADVTGLLSAKAAGKGLALAVDVSLAIPVNLMGDALRIKQVLINLASNAVKFTEHGHVTIWVHEQERQGGEIILRFEVVDTGIGISPEQGRRLFQSFQQGDASTTRRYGGSGLGLIISKRLVELMGGEIGMSSEPGVGSTFWFTTRLKLSTQASPEHAASADVAVAISPAQLVGVRALVVEDNEFNQQVAVEFLQAMGLEVEVAENGAIGVERVRDGDYDIVLMDMLMPVMDGLDATRAIRKLPGHEHLPILALTANAMAEDRDRCIAAGMDDHIAKPIDPEDLRAKLLKWVKAVEPGVRGPAALAAPTTEADACPDPALGPQWNGIEGLDTQRGLRMSMGRAALYLDSLWRFVRGHQGDPGKITQAIEADDWEGARRLSHTLKGVAGQVGAEPISAVAQRLEQACSPPRDAAKARSAQAELARLLPPLAAAIAERLPAPQAPVADPASDLTDWPRVRDTLRSLLKDDDAASLRYLDENREVLRAGLGERYPEVAMAVGNFEFLTALAKLT